MSDPVPIAAILEDVGAGAAGAPERDGDRKCEALDAVEIIGPDCSDGELVALDEARRKLGVVDRRGCDVVKLRSFAGLTIEPAAEVLGVSLVTANRDRTWTRARLTLELSGADPADESGDS